MIPKAWRKFKYDKITIIQKYIRGFIVYKRVFTELNNTKLQSAFDYFDKVKAVLKVNSQIKIRYCYFRWKRLMKVKEEEEAKNKTMKKGRKGSNMRKGNASYKSNLMINSTLLKKPKDDTPSSKTVASFRAKRSDDYSPTKKSQNNIEIDNHSRIERVLEEDLEDEEDFNTEMS
jgi:hypothetical protein